MIDKPSARRPRQGEGAVFDTARGQSIDPEVRAKIPRPQGQVFGHFNSRRDPPAKEIVTARLLGDPVPGRPWPDAMDAPSRIPLTFREMRAAHGETA